MDEERAKEIALQIRDEFEDLHDEKDITIPSADREGVPGEARLFGEENSRLEEAIVGMLVEQAETKLTNEDIDEADHPARSLAIRICDEFEDLLEEKDIMIPSANREGRRPEEARLYGEEYWRMEDTLTDILVAAFGPNGGDQINDLAGGDATMYASGTATSSTVGTVAPIEFDSCSRI